MTHSDVLVLAILPALSLLPERMTSQNAIAMMLAIGMQESRFLYRRQITARGYGPARGWFQFERAGVRGVLKHEATRPYAEDVARRLGYAADDAKIHLAIEHNDILAAVFARLNLWWIPRALPRCGEPGEAWHQYLTAWAPGRPHQQTWNGFYAKAWELA